MLSELNHIIRRNIFKSLVKKSRIKSENSELRTETKGMAWVWTGQTVHRETLKKCE